MNRGLLYSLICHFFIVCVFIAVFKKKTSEPIKEVFKFQVLEKITKVTQISKVPPPIVPKKVTKSKPSRKVFGLSKKSIVTKKNSGVVAKTGNTTAKTPDKKILKDSDKTSLPIPADEFLVTSMPRVLTEIRPTYPEEIKKLGIEGAVIFEIIVDSAGIVRNVVLLKPLNPVLDKNALTAIQQFKFKPAYIKDNPVAVKIKYAINFVLEK